MPNCYRNLELDYLTFGFQHWFYIQSLLNDVSWNWGRSLSHGVSHWVKDSWECTRKKQFPWKPQGYCVLAAGGESMPEGIKQLPEISRADRDFNKRRTSKCLISFGQTPNGNAYLSGSSPSSLTIDRKLLLKANFIKELVRRNVVVCRLNSKQTKRSLQSPISWVGTSHRRHWVQEENGWQTGWVCPLVRWEISTSLEVILSPALTRVANAFWIPHKHSGKTVSFGETSDSWLSVGLWTIDGANVVCSGYLTGNDKFSLPNYRQEGYVML